ncbi:MAG: hypothetical protein ACRD2N_21310, partial [Vicinamibacterales bacterium]
CSEPECSEHADPKGRDMLTPVTATVAALVALAQTPAPPQSQPAPPKPTDPAAEKPADPATSSFTTEAGLILVLIKPDKTEDFELAIRTLQEKLSADSDPARRAIAAGWRVFKAAEADEKGNVVYVHALLPATPGFDYRPSLLLDELLGAAPPELLTKYRDAFAAAPTKLTLTEFANMSVAPVTPAPVAPPKKPGG